MYLTSSRNNHFKSTVELQEAHFMDFKISFLFSWQMWTINLETKIKLQHLWFYIVKFDSRPGKHGIRHHVKYGVYCIFAISPQKIKSEIFSLCSLQKLYWRIELLQVKRLTSVNIVTMLLPPAATWSGTRTFTWTCESTIATSVAKHSDRKYTWSGTSSTNMRSGLKKMFYTIHALACHDVFSK